MTSPIGYVLQGDTDFDKAKYERHISITRPRSQTIINNHQYALHLKQNVVPESDIFARNIDPDGDGNDFTQYTPTAYFDKYAPLTANGALGLQVNNEGDFSPGMAAKLLPFMQEAVARKIRISIPGVAVGNTPSSAAGWALYDSLVGYSTHHPDYIVWDVHEYFVALPTSGMITADTQPGDVLYFATQLRQPDQWRPKKLSDFTNFYHVGRCKHLFEYCAQKGYPAPVVDLGEFGADFVKDSPPVELWANAIKATNADHISGYKSLQDYWQVQFPEWMPSEAYYQMIRWLWEHILQPIGVRSARLFNWTAGKQWAEFNIANDPSLQLWLETFYATPSQPPPPPPVVLPNFPFDFDPRAKDGIAQVRKPLEIYERPSFSAAVKGTLTNGERIKYIPDANLKPTERIVGKSDKGVAPFIPVQNAAKGWVWAFDVYMKPVPPPPNAAEIFAELTQRIQATADRIGRVGLELANLREELSKDLELLKELAPLLPGKKDVKNDS